MPCHTTSWFVGYPELASGKPPYEIQTKWGVFSPAMDPTRETTFTFISRFVGEMTTIFPDAYFHVGGDECNGREWDASPRVQAFMHDHHFKDNAALQTYFTGRVQKIVEAHHRITVGWDEVLQPDTPKNVVVQSWRGPKGLAAAARKGNRAILSNGYYIDLNEQAARHYLVDPLGGDNSSLSAEEQNVLGGEATMWSEFTPAEIIDSRIWPRTAAIAERFWSPQDVRDVNSMYTRMALVSDKLNAYGLTLPVVHRVPMLERMSGASDPKYLVVLASVVQPPMGYQRESLKEYDWHSPLNHLVDAAAPESDAARVFKNLVDAIVAGNATPEQWQNAKNCLTLWRDNDAKLEPSLKNSDITAELIPVSQTLAQVSTIGLRALDDLQNHHATERATTESDSQILKAAEKPQAVLRDMIVAPVEALVTAAGVAQKLCSPRQNSAKARVSVLTNLRLHCFRTQRSHTL